MNNSSSTSPLQKLNDEKAILLIPAMFFVGVLMFTGFIGNIAVCYFYGCKTRKTPTSCFIFGLAIFDILSCTISMPMEIVDMRYFYMFPDVTACRLLRATNFVCTIASGFILIAIATERYRRICIPFRKQITIVQARIICVVSVFIACVVSWPSLLFYTVVNVDVPFTGSEIVQGHDCTTVKDDSLNVYLNAFNIIQILLFIFSAITLIVLYALVCRQLIKLKRVRKYGSWVDRVIPKPSEVLNSNNKSLKKWNHNEDMPNGCSNNTEVIISVKSLKEANRSKMTNNNITKLTSGSKVMTKETAFMREEPIILNERNSAKEDKIIRPATFEQISNFTQLEKERDQKDFSTNKGTDSLNKTSEKYNSDIVKTARAIKKSRLVYSISRQMSNEINPVRYTILMIVITVAYIVSFLPHLCLVVWRSLSTDYEVNSMTDLQLVFFSIGIRSYFLNSALNPMIYGLFNSQFRYFFTSVFCRCCGARRNCMTVCNAKDTPK
ncbi:hypothetical protein CHS0354_039257 [Potamilus streckersoni]|uniref:G-protein coupled receptors family 1 profile domain-containing protein n=1 Tax=Potamilus streckersoni TaxID=2493646 RepID=A0AAE0S3I3_9BIVA|nr:hypothetical protein CHS0354_039257 [Potamilus streckersoni]